MFTFMFVSFIFSQLLSGYAKKFIQLYLSFAWSGTTVDAKPFINQDFGQIRLKNITQ